MLVFWLSALGTATCVTSLDGLAGFENNVSRNAIRSSSSDFWNRSWASMLSFIALGPNSVAWKRSATSQ